MEVRFDVYSKEERAIVIRAAEELDRLYAQQVEEAKQKERCFDGAKLDAQMPYIPTVASGTVTAPPIVVPNFVEEFRKQAQRIGAPAALAVLRDQFGVNRATEVPEGQQANLIGAMLVMPALNA